MDTIPINNKRILLVDDEVEILKVSLIIDIMVAVVGGLLFKYSVKK